MLEASGRPLHIGTGPGPAGPAWIADRRSEGVPVAHQRVGAFVDTRFSLAGIQPIRLYAQLGSRARRNARGASRQAEAARNPGGHEARSRGPAPSEDQLGEDKVFQVFNERNYRYEGLTVPQLAEAMGGIHPVEALIDLSLDEDLRTEFGFRNEGPRSRKRWPRHQGPLHPRVGLRRWRAHAV